MKPTAKDIVEIIKKHRESAYLFQERRIADWNDTYILYRDKPILNRLTQRQHVHIPLLKSITSTLIKEMDDLPMLYFDNLDNDDQKEVFYNEYWAASAKKNKHATKDIVDKKQALLYGRTFKKQNIIDGKHTYEIVDIQNMLVDRFVDPTDIDTANFILQKGIYRTLSQLENDQRLNQSVINKMKLYYLSAEGLVKAEETTREAFDSAQRMSDLGLEDAWNPKTGETIIELNEVYLRRYDEAYGRDIYYLYIIANNAVADEPLFSARLCDVLGKTEDDFWCDHTPYTTWGMDPEHLDFWSDGPGDIVRSTNKVVNSFFSQLIENRTLRNFNMNYYDNSVEGFNPETFVPEPWGWYPIPGNPNEMTKQIEVADLSESLDEIQFAMDVTKEAVAATATSEGSVQTNVTLGEVQLALKNAQERIKHVSIFYTEAWEDFGVKYIKLLEGSSHLLDPIKVSKRGRLTKRVYTRVISPNDWLSKSGYRVDVKMLADKQTEDVEKLQKLNYAKSLMPMNQPLIEIIKKKALEFGGLNMDETKAVMDAEKQLAMMPQPMPMPGGQPMQVPGTM